MFFCQRQECTMTQHFSQSFPEPGWHVFTRLCRSMAPPRSPPRPACLPVLAFVLFALLSLSLSSSSPPFRSSLSLSLSLLLLGPFPLLRRLMLHPDRKSERGNEGTRERGRGRPSLCCRIRSPKAQVPSPRLVGVRPAPLLLNRNSLANGHRVHRFQLAWRLGVGYEIAIAAL